MQQRTKDWAIQIGIGIIYSLLLSVAISFGFIFVAVQFIKDKINIDTVMLTNFGGLFAIFFILTMPLIITFQTIRLSYRYPSATKDFYGIGAKLRSMTLEKRQSLVAFNKVVIILNFLIFLFLSLILVQATILNPGYKSLMFDFDFVAYFGAYSLVLLNKFLINSNEWVQFNMQKYQKTRDCRDLERALRSYNKVLGSSLSLKRIIAISQYVKESYKISTADETKELDTLLERMLNNVNLGNNAEIDDNIIAVAELTEKITKEHQKTLGFEPRYPLRIQLNERLRASTSKIFPEVMVFIAWIGIVIVLAKFGIVNVSLPP